MRYGVAAQKGSERNPEFRPKRGRGISHGVNQGINLVRRDQIHPKGPKIFGDRAPSAELCSGKLSGENARDDVDCRVFSVKPGYDDARRLIGTERLRFLRALVKNILPTSNLTARRRPADDCADPRLIGP